MYRCAWSAIEVPCSEDLMSTALEGRWHKHTDLLVIFVVSEVGCAHWDGTEFTSRGSDIHGRELEATTLA